MGWDDVVKLLSNLPSLSTITQNIKDGANNAIGTYNAITLRLWQGRLRSLRDDVININAAKLQNLQDMADYLHNAAYHKSWTELQSNWSKIPQQILALSSDISVGTDARVTTMAVAISIKDILSRQAVIYTALSTLPEPQKGSAQWTDLESTYEKLQEMYNQVTALESAIDDYLHAHPT
jgi:hypothetical protein